MPSPAGSRSHNQVLVHLLAQRGLHRRLHQLLEQPVRACQQVQACGLGIRTTVAARCSVDCPTGFLFVTSSSVAVITALSAPNLSSTCQTENAAFGIVPLPIGAGRNAIVYPSAIG